MKLLTKSILKKLLKNGQSRGVDHFPAVKFFNPVGAATWLITEAEEVGGDIILFGLCDLGVGLPELGSVSLNELSSFRGRMGLGIERDLHFSAKKPLSEYTKEAMLKGRIVA